MGFSLSDLSPMTWSSGGIDAFSLIPGVGAYKGQQEANEMNWRIAEARNEFERDEAEKARNFSSAEALKNRQFTGSEAASLRTWQEQMSSSAVQRRMKDMKAAGINPILAGKYDASTPAGAMGVGSQPATAKANAHGAEMKSAFIDTLPLINSAIDIKKKLAEVKGIQAQTQGTEAGLPKKKGFGRLWDTIFSDYTRIQDAADKYQNSARKGEGYLDQADKYLNKVIVEPLKSLEWDKGKKLKNPFTGHEDAIPIKGFDENGVPIYYE